MPAQTPSPASAPKAAFSVVKVCSVLLLFVAMLTAACLPLQVSWLWLLLPLVFLVYLDASANGAQAIAAVVAPQFWLFYLGLAGVALAFEFAGLHPDGATSARSASGGGGGCGCGSSKALVATPAPTLPPVSASRYPTLSSQRPSPSVRPVTPTKPQVLMPPRPAAPLSTPASSPATPGSQPPLPTGSRGGVAPEGSPTQPEAQTKLPATPASSTTARPSVNPPPAVPGTSPAGK